MANILKLGITRASVPLHRSPPVRGRGLKLVGDAQTTLRESRPPCGGAD